MEAENFSEHVGDYHVRYVTSEEAERELMANEFHITEGDWRRQEMLTAENSKDLATLTALFNKHCEESNHMDRQVQEDVRALSDNMTRVLVKLDNGINTDIDEIKQAVGKKLDAAVYTGALQHTQQTRKWRLEILTVITAVCAVAATVAGILL